MLPPWVSLPQYSSSNRHLFERGVQVRPLQLHPSSSPSISPSPLPLLSLPQKNPQISPSRRSLSKHNHYYPQAQSYPLNLTIQQLKCELLLSSGRVEFMKKMTFPINSTVHDLQRPIFPIQLRFWVVWWHKKSSRSSQNSISQLRVFALWI